jgi:hypothetical protein
MFLPGASSREGLPIPDGWNEVRAGVLIISSRWPHPVRRRA